MSGLHSPHPGQITHSLAPSHAVCHENGLLSALSCGFGRAFEGDLITASFEAAREIGDGATFTDLVETGISKSAIDPASGEPVTGGHDNLVSNRQGGPQRTAPGLEAVELVPRMAAFGSRRGNGAADQDRAPRYVALAGAPALLLACPLVAAGANPGPGGQVGGR
jgi:hypothetical protein